MQADAPTEKSQPPLAVDAGLGRAAVYVPLGHCSHLPTLDSGRYVVSGNPVLGGKVSIVTIVPMIT